MMNSFGSPEETSSALADLMAEAIWLAFEEARMALLQELRRKPVRKYDSYGLHAFSEQFGRIHACQSLDPDFLGRVLVSPVLMRKAAEDAAYAEFLNEVQTAAQPQKEDRSS